MININQTAHDQCFVYPDSICKEHKCIQWQFDNKKGWHCYLMKNYEEHQKETLSYQVEVFKMATIGEIYILFKPIFDCLVKFLKLGKKGD